jgi:hypothetical protein
VISVRRSRPNAFGRRTSRRRLPPLVLRAVDDRNRPLHDVGVEAVARRLVAISLGQRAATAAGNNNVEAVALVEVEVDTAAAELWTIPRASMHAMREALALPA